MALAIVQHPGATAEDKLWPSLYLGGWGATVATGAAGAGLLTCSTVPSCAKAIKAVLGITTAASADGNPINEVNVVTSTASNVLSRITPTQSNWEGTSLPKSVTISTSNGQFWVHANATKHIRDLLVRIPTAVQSRAEALGANSLANRTQLAQQIVLESLDDAIVQATKNGIVYDRMMRIGNWELIFGQAAQEGLLPVLYHANYILP